MLSTNGRNGSTAVYQGLGVTSSSCFTSRHWQKIADSHSSAMKRLSFDAVLGHSNGYPLCKRSVDRRKRASHHVYIQHWGGLGHTQRGPYFDGDGIEPPDGSSCIGEKQWRDLKEAKT